MPLASVAAMQGRIAVAHILGDTVHPLRTDEVASNIFTSPEIASVGITQQDVEADPAMFTGMTMNLATIFPLKGINLTLSAACASGSHSIGMGYLMIKSGLQEMVICGGAQEINKYAMGNFDALSAFSIRESEPAKASRPFDRDRDGLVPSGGAATVIIESLESAQRRGATILGEIVGYGFSSNGAHISNPTVEGPVRALAKSLADAGLRSADIDYINAHGTSTPLGDEIELFKQGARRRLYCVHCGHFQDIGSEGECTCGQCRVKLFVREHFSQRLGAYMGVCIDPDSPFAPEVSA